MEDSLDKSTLLLLLLNHGVIKKARQTAMTTGSSHSINVIYPCLPRLKGRRNLMSGLHLKNKCIPS